MRVPSPSRTSCRSQQPRRGGGPPGSGEGRHPVPTCQAWAGTGDQPLPEAPGLNWAATWGFGLAPHVPGCSSCPRTPNPPAPRTQHCRRLVHIPGRLGSRGAIWVGRRSIEVARFALGLGLPLGPGTLGTSLGSGFEQPAGRPAPVCGRCSKPGLPCSLVRIWLLSWGLLPFPKAGVLAPRADDQTPGSRSGEPPASPTGHVSHSPMSLGTRLHSASAVHTWPDGNPRKEIFPGFCFGGWGWGGASCDI